MDTRNILDAGNNVVGTLTLPDGTAEAIWSSQLTLYKNPLTQTVSDYVLVYAVYGLTLQTLFQTENITMGILTSGKLQALNDYMSTWFNLLTTGSLNLAINILSDYMADVSSEKTNLIAFIPNDRLLDYQNQIKTYLGI